MEVSVEDRRDGLDRETAPWWLSPSAYLLPVHFPPSAWFAHGPFASWLVDALRPTDVVELGTHYGFSCFAFAEAAKRLGLDCTISALDSWEGDDHAGHYGREVFEYVQRVANEDYAGRVRLVRGWFSDSRHLFADHSVDVLHIDGRHRYEDVVADYEQWAGCVRDGGVILFHDIAEHQDDFGVWKLWGEIAEPGRSFTFKHGHGLGVLAVGTTANPALRALFDADHETAERIRADFVRLGSVVERQVWLESLPAELEKVWAEVRQRALHEDQQAAALDAQHEHIVSLEASTSWRVTAPLRALRRLSRGKS